MTAQLGLLTRPGARIMASAEIAGEVVRFDIKRAGLSWAKDPGGAYLPMRMSSSCMPPPQWEVITPERWPAWCRDNVASILPALPKATRTRIEARLAQGTSSAGPAS